MFHRTSLQKNIEGKNKDECIVNGKNSDEARRKPGNNGRFLSDAPQVQALTEVQALPDRGPPEPLSPI